MNEFVRIQKVTDAQEDSVFLWGARQVGKSTLIKKLYPDAKIYDLLKSDEYTRLLRRPQLLREELLSFGQETLVVIDEIQKIPQLLDEVHWLIVNCVWLSVATKFHGLLTNTPFRQLERA